MRERALRDRIDELEEECRQLREQLLPIRSFPAALRLSKTETAILSFILARAPNVALKERIIFAVWPDPDDAPDTKTLDVHICKLRKKLQPFGLEIGLAWGEGYILSADAAAVLRGWLNGDTPEPVVALPAPKPVLLLPAPTSPPAQPKPAPILPAPEPQVTKAQIRAIKGFASVDNDARWIARQVELPFGVVKSILKGKRE